MDAALPTRPGGSKTQLIGSSSSSALPPLSMPGGTNSDKTPPLPTVSNSPAFAFVTSVRLFSFHLRLAGLLLPRHFCPDGFFRLRYRGTFSPALSGRQLPFSLIITKV